MLEKMRNSRFRINMEEEKMRNSRFTSSREENKTLTPLGGSIDQI
jgi:hypothetical protein